MTYLNNPVDFFTKGNAMLNNEISQSHLLDDRTIQEFLSTGMC